MNRLKQKYIEQVLPALKKEMNKPNDLAVPRLLKVVVSVGLGSKEANKTKAFESMTEQLKVITGQKPKQTAAKQSIAGFNIRQGEPVGLTVTLRGDRMWEFFDKLVSIVLPRFKDFQGVSRKAFDKSGNYNLGIAEQIVFPEIEYDTIDRVRGLQVTVVTSTKDSKEAMILLEKLGMPFEKEAK
ncbi:MAG: 50S ribosomal protein L5 [Candidatus Pacebacteria bacterium]|nr:50S ribosomal protein L5 [Candidatus Paceibacterota bacterium]